MIKSPGELAVEQIRRGCVSEVQVFFDFFRTKRRLKKHSGEKLVHKTWSRNRYTMIILQAANDSVFLHLVYLSVYKP